jgi:hypothetical protein
VDVMEMGLREGAGGEQDDEAREEGRFHIENTIAQGPQSTFRRQESEWPGNGFVLRRIRTGFSLGWATKMGSFGSFVWSAL